MASSSILSTADSCLLSLPNKSPFLHTALTTTKPLLHFRHNRASNLSLSVKKTDNNSRRRRKLVPFVAETSEFWQEDEKTLTIEEGQGEGEGEEEEARWENDETGFEVEASGEGEGEGEVEEEGEFVVEDGDVEVNEDAKLFVGNLPYDVDSQQLAGLFQQAGVVEIAEVIYNRDTDQSRGFGFVTMSTVEEAEKAVEMFHRYDLQGRLLTVNKAAPRGQRPERPPRVFEPSYRIYVGNLPWDVDNAQLEQVFSEHGKVVNARVVKDRETGRSRGFGFVSMSSESEMNDAIAALDGQTMDGRAIRVNVAEQRSSRTF